MLYMNDFLNELDWNKDKLMEVIGQLENKEEYMKPLKEYLPSLNQITKNIFELVNDPNVLLELNTQFYMQVLNDIVNGMENQDTVILLDTLKYGLLEIYLYIENELRGREVYE